MIQLNIGKKIIIGLMLCMVVHVAESQKIKEFFKQQNQTTVEEKKHEPLILKLKNTKTNMGLLEPDKGNEPENTIKNVGVAGNHIPLMVLIDDRALTRENESVSYRFDAITEFLIQGVLDNIPIIASQELLEALFNLPAVKNLSLEQFDELGGWKKVNALKFKTNKAINILQNSYDIVWLSSSFFLLVPKNSNYAMDAFNEVRNYAADTFNKLRNNAANDTGIESLNQEVLEGTDSKKTTLADQLCLIFNTIDTTKKKGYVFDVYIVGHGLSGEYIGGVSIDEMGKIVGCLDRGLSTGVVMIHSCFIGGPNKDYLRNFIPDLSFPLVIGGVDETVTIFVENLSFSELFKKAAALKIDENGLNNLLLYLESSSGEISGKEVSHKHLNIPQVLLPRGISWFTAYSKKVKNIGIVTEKVHQKENLPISSLNNEKKPTSVVLVWPLLMRVPLQIYPVTSRENLGEKKDKIHDVNKFWKYFPTLNDLTSKHDIMFPIIIPMDKTEKIQYFKKIELFDSYAHKKYPELGVMQGVRDMFFDIFLEQPLRMILVESITGNNDLLNLLKKIRELQKIDTVSDLEKILIDNASKVLELEQVMIAIESDNKSIRINLNFICNDKVWLWYWSSDSGEIWNFEQGSDDDKKNLREKFKNFFERISKLNEYEGGESKKIDINENENNID